MTEHQANSDRTPSEQTEQDADISSACDYAAQVLGKRRALLASPAPGDQARALRMTLALAELLAAEAELMEQETADAPPPPALIKGFLAAWLPKGEPVSPGCECNQT